MWIQERSATKNVMSLLSVSFSLFVFIFRTSASVHSCASSDAQKNVKVGHYTHKITLKISKTYIWEMTNRIGFFIHGIKKRKINWSVYMEFLRSFGMLHIEFLHDRHVRKPIKRDNHGMLGKIFAWRTRSQLLNGLKHRNKPIFMDKNAEDSKFWNVPKLFPNTSWNLTALKSSEKARKVL